MGIYYRYAAAAIILLFCTEAYSATRKNVNMPTKESVIKGGGDSFQTPNGSAAYFGQDYVDYHTAGNRFNANDNPSGMSGNDLRAKQKVTVKPVLTASPNKAAKAVISGMRGGLPGVVASAAAAAIVEALDGVIEDGVIRVPHIEEVSGPNSFYWAPAISDPRSGPSPQTACQVMADALPDGHSNKNFTHLQWDSSTQVGCGIHNSGGRLGTVYRFGSSCPAGSTYNASLGRCEMTSLSSPSDSDWTSMENWASARDSDFVRDMVRASCEGSSSPAACYDDLTDWADMQGPASQTGPAQVTTTTKTNPDGTVSTTTTTTQNRYEYNFGPTYYNYSTTTKVTENKDGVVTETETSNGLPTDEPTQEEDAEYTFDDAEFPEVPSFYERKYPDGLEGVWQQARADVDQSPFMQFLQGFIPSFSGSCPTFGLGFNIASWANYGTVQFSSICYVLDFVKIILLVTALFTFRKVTFGG